jgi:hypothetical protein
MTSWARYLPPARRRSYRPGMARPSLKALFRNFDDYDAPFDRKIAKALRNNARKVVTLSDCCGHPGEPGC